MLTQGEDVEVQALASRGWSVSAIACRLDRDRKTVRAYVRGARQPGVRARTAPDPLAPFAGYLASRCDRSLQSGGDTAGGSRNPGDW